jgi:2-dehydro-3-deoxygluconokinase
MIRVAAIGECMIELACREGTSPALGFGGDTLNTAVYLARCGSTEGIAVDYVTALGTDPMSDAMIAAWTAEAIGVAKVERRADRLPGLYMIRTDDSGERRFFYWRQQAAARELFLGDGADRLLASLIDYDAIYFSGITLAVLAPEARERLRQMLLLARRRGTRVVFDSNYRPALWSSTGAAQLVLQAFLPALSLALPSFEDEARLWGDQSPEATARRYNGAGVPEVVVKGGAAGCWVLFDGTLMPVPAPTVITPTDTTAAGDAFNAAYLAARLRGHSPAEAALRGHRLAGVVIGHAGAIIPRALTPDIWTDPGPRLS